MVFETAQDTTGFSRWFFTFSLGSPFKRAQDTTGFSRWSFNFTLATFDTSALSSVILMTPHFTTLDAAYQLHCYLCFKTRYLRPILETQRQKSFVHAVVDDVCLREHYKLLDFDITDSYLKLLLSLRPAHTVDHTAKMLKGNVSRKFGLVFREQLERHESKTLWARGYFARSSGKVNLAQARHYVDLQVRHHGYKGEWARELTYKNPDFKSPAFSLDHCLCMLDYHIVLVTENRVPIFDESIAAGLFGYVMAISRRHHFAVDRISVLPDHLHLIIEAMPKVSVEQCVLAILNNTRYWMTKYYWGVLKQMGAWNLWRPSFYAGTVGEFSTAQVRRFLSGPSD